MRRHVIIASLAGSLAIFLQTINFFESVVMFLLFGIVPWQIDPLSPHLMLALYYLLFATVALVIFRKHVTSVIRSQVANSQAQA